MRIAVTYDNGMIFQHFGHTEQFKLYDYEGDELIHRLVRVTEDDVPEIVKAIRRKKYEVALTTPLTFP